MQPTEQLIETQDQQPQEGSTTPKNSFYSQFFNSTFLRDCELSLPESEKKYNAHKLILSASSKFFKDIFKNQQTEENAPSLSQVTLPKPVASNVVVDPSKIFSSILEFFYSNQELEDLLHHGLNENNAFSYLSCLESLESEVGIKLATEYINKTALTPDNCCSMLYDAIKIDNEALKKSAQNIVVKCFEDVIEKNGQIDILIKTPFNIIKEILSQDELQIQEENVLVKIVADYIKAREELQTEEEIAAEIEEKKKAEEAAAQVPAKEQEKNEEPAPEQKEDNPPEGEEKPEKDAPEGEKQPEEQGAEEKKPEEAKEDPPKGEEPKKEGEDAEGDKPKEDDAAEKKPEEGEEGAEKEAKAENPELKSEEKQAPPAEVKQTPPSFIDLEVEAQKRVKMFKLTDDQKKELIKLIRLPYLNHDTLMNAANLDVFSPFKEIFLESLSAKLNNYEASHIEKYSINIQPRQNFNPLVKGPQGSSVEQQQPIQIPPGGQQPSLQQQQFQQGLQNKQQQQGGPGHNRGASATQQQQQQQSAKYPYQQIQQQTQQGQNLQQGNNVNNNFLENIGGTFAKSAQSYLNQYQQKPNLSLPQQQPEFESPNKRSQFPSQADNHNYNQLQYPTDPNSKFQGQVAGYQGTPERNSYVRDSQHPSQNQYPKQASGLYNKSGGGGLQNSSHLDHNMFGSTVKSQQLGGNAQLGSQYPNASPNDKKSQIQAANDILGQSQKNPIIQFNYKYDFDDNGALYYLGSSGKRGPWQNPHKVGQIKVFFSSLGKGGVEDFVGRDCVNCRTLNEPGSFMGVDLGVNRYIIPTCYTIRNRNSSHHVLMNWVLEVSINGKEWFWVDKRVHLSEEEEVNQSMANEREELKQKGFTSTWGIDGNQVKKISKHLEETQKTKFKGFRYFKIVQISKNSSGSHNLALSGLEVYGIAQGDNWLFLQ